MDIGHTCSLLHGNPLPACICPKMIGQTDAAVESCITVDTNLLSFKSPYKKHDKHDNIITKVNKAQCMSTSPTSNASYFTNVPTIPCLNNVWVLCYLIYF